jgi:transcriptional regulator with XRE-family HTH domain
MPQTPGQRLQLIRNMLNLSRNDVHCKYGIPVPTLRSWELGKTKIGLKALYRCMECYKQEGILCSSEWILEGKGLEPQRTQQLQHLFQTPQMGEIQADDVLMLKEMQYFQSLHPSAVMIQVANDEMLPYYQIGDYLAGIPVDPSLWIELDQQHCIVELPNKLSLVRKFIVTNKANAHFSLIMTNPLALSHEPIMYNPSLVNVAPIIMHRRPTHAILASL